MTNQEYNIQTKTNQLTDAQLLEFKDIKMLTGINSKGRNVLCVWKGRQQRPYHNYWYRSETLTIEAAMRVMTSAELREERKLKAKKEKAAFTPEFEVGTIYYDSWGYDQTNVNFYEVVEVASKHYAIVREIHTATVEGETDRVTAAKGSFKENSMFLGGAEKRVKVGQYGITVERGHKASKWDGRSKYETNPYNRR